ncbi:iron-containing alcohol dehydrogenase [Pseudomonas psychrophila]|uniref:Alcohol dehydrogenase, class IV n=1 Tax=Pseudomonas psychrophila TaxID=122355 RepID=A0ABY0VRS9_9PSED|nr:iron-containing alcohol dehydrogenase [Pseudomonas psychrophila]KAB0488992.1 iron-containing alcohol dehydrogenase [Pseudomonas psychrophila]KMN02355.1 alcohol dehydrogenase [Pseudomonas psychrophila]QIE32680.1 iron-containing alcohol dehydrogenase [Pseudomonas psychrophila]WVI99230.1 iron-containing alcohol dehydrogenase [Pseudomonas psychrophila]SDU51831.1 Alcohol dehydrogenase, class IV [Pseudomonas psychrophila]
MNHEFRSVPRIICEAGALQEVGSVFRGLGAQRVILVCDPGIVSLGFAGQAQAVLETAGCEVAVFDQVAPDPSSTLVEQAVKQAQGFKADGVLGLGGGSSLDAAKLVALLINSEQSLEDLYGTDKAQGQRTPLVLMPTTSGTGSEVTWVSVITDAQQRKQAVYSPQLLPDVAILDPQLTLGLPAKVTAATGLDAMVHAIEAYTSRTRKNPISDGLATSALALLGANLPKVLANGRDLEARTAMLQGSLMAGMAFVNASVAAIHALAYPLGARFHIPHGHANALVMAPVIRFNLASAQRHYAELAGHLLQGQHFDNEASAAEAFVQAVEGLVKDSGLEQRLSNLNVDQASLPVMASEVVVGIRRLIDSNPCDMTEQDVEAIYRSIY